MGISRSATVLIAYLMKTRNLSPEEAMEKVRAIRPFICPNLSFRLQLDLYWDMGCPDQVQEQPKYQRWLFRKQLEKSNAIGKPPKQIVYYDQEKAAAEVQGSEEASSESMEIELRCKRCR